jgi:hypothetical protein
VRPDRLSVCTTIARSLETFAPLRGYLTDGFYIPHRSTLSYHIMTTSRLHYFLQSRYFLKSYAVCNALSTPMGYTFYWYVTCSGEIGFSTHSTLFYAGGIATRFTKVRFNNTDLIATVLIRISSEVGPASRFERVSGRAQSLRANFGSIDPHHTLYSRGASDVQHILAAVGSRSVKSAQNFINQVCEDKQLASKVIPCGSYQELYDNPQVDCIYIGEPIDNIWSSWPLLKTSG